jgi:site-specific recombinase XerD
VTPPHGDLIDAYLTHLTRIRRSPRTVSTYGSILGQAHRQLPEGLPQALPGELETWLGNDTWTAATQNLYTTCVRSFFTWTVDHRHLSHNPAEKLIPPAIPYRLPHPATDEEAATVLTHAPEPVLTWSVLAAFAGARGIEIWGMTYADIGEFVRIHGKGRKDRLVPTHAAITAHVAGRDGWVAADTNGNQLASERRVTGPAWRTYRRLGVEIGIHRLRGWFATTALRHGADLATVQDLLGHASPVTTRRYATPSGEQLRRAVASLPAVADDPGR